MVPPAARPQAPTAIMLPTTLAARAAHTRCISWAGPAHQAAPSQQTPPVLISRCPLPVFIRTAQS
jgi:hypothetical protein